MSDVAQRCNVSVKTVSRVVNNLPGASPETTRRILDAIAELGFRRNDLAMDLRQSRATSTIGLLIEDSANPFYGPLVRAVEERARADGALVVTVSSNEDGARERDLIDALCARRVAGMLIVTATADHGFLTPEIQRGLPVVFVDRPPSGLDTDCVLLDNAGGTREAVEHLIRQGHRRIGVIGDHPHVHTVIERVRGYRETLERHSITVDDSLVRLGRHLAPEASAAVHELFALPDPPTALFTLNNRSTAGALRALRDRRVLAAVVGFDDFEFADMLVPAATVVWSDPAEMGRVAADLLFRRMAGEAGESRRIVLPTRLVIRGSGEIRP